ncbi:MAG: DNA-directed RNA polymerase subunit K [Nanoarchaeota archaeon]
MAEIKQEFTKYEVARIIGARALQISMDAPLLLKISDDDLKGMRYDALKISEKEFSSDVLPISVKRPMPKRTSEKLKAIKDDNVDDEKIAEKEKEIEKEIQANADEMGLVNENEADDTISEETNGEEAA